MIFVTWLTVDADKILCAVFSDDEYLEFCRKLLATKEVIFMRITKGEDFPEFGG